MILDGKPSLFTTWRDITERIRAQKALLESGYRWKFAIEGSGDGVWDWDIQSDEVKYSKRWKEMLGYSDNDILPANQEWVGRIHPDDQSYVAEAMRAYLDGKAASYVVEYRLRCKDENYKWILARGMVVSRSDDGNPLRMIGTHTDITERKRVEMALEESNRKLEALSATDGLTRIANRRRFDEVLAQEHARLARSWTELSLILLDIDHFKAFNDSYGHVNGDECLRQVARVIADCTARPADLAARYGGEEFACILPETDRKGAVAIAEKIRSGIIALAIPHKGSSVAEYVTASMGVVTVKCTPDGSAVEIVAQADDLLYRAKSCGRNRVEFDLQAISG
jgi:diguanylate cyclase (GGDEF)-like protein/PAS domain S-box-containing protein